MVHRTPLRQCCAAALLALAVVALTGQAEPETPAEPVPLRRVLLPADRLATELQRAREGVLTRLPRDEFEKLVRQARGGADHLPPRLIEARYRASLVEDAEQASLSGSAEWKLLHRGPAPGLFRLGGEGPAFNLAVRQPRFANRDAILAPFPEPGGSDATRSLALLVDQAGESTLTMEWSARTDPRPEGVHVELRLPPSPAAVLELDLPADRSVLAAGGLLLTGPQRAEKDNRRLWRVACGGRSQLSLVIRRGTPAATPVVQVWQKTVQRLLPEGMETATTFTLEALHQDLASVVIDCDPQLRPLDVASPHLDRFEIQPGRDGGPTRLTVRLTRPLRQAVVEVRCLAPLGPTASDDRSGDRPLILPWTSPALRLVHGRAAATDSEVAALPRGETLEVWVHPDLPLVSWQPGDFRLGDSSLVVDPERKVSMRRLTLTGGGLASDPGGPRRPAGQLQAGGVDVRARQQSWWRLGSDGMELWVQVGFEVLQGQMFQLVLQLPAGWEAETAEMAPSEQMRSWSVRAHPGGSRLVVDLHRPLQAGGKDAAATLTARLRRPGRPVSKEIAFPDVVPLHTRFREGGLGIDVDEQLFRAVLRSPIVAAEPPASSLWGNALPVHYYPFQVASPVGTLRLMPRPPRFRSRVRTEVHLAGRRGLLSSRLVLEGETGTINHVEVLRTGGTTQPGEWRVESAGVPAGNRIRHVERLQTREVAAALLPLAGGGPLGVAALSALRPEGTLWRLTFDRPLPLHQGLIVRALHPLMAGRDTATPTRWDVPLLLISGTSRLDGEVRVYLEGADLLAVESAGMQERPPDEPTPEGAPLPGRVLAYGDGRLPHLTLLSRSATAGPFERSQFDRGRLTTLVSDAAELRHHFRFRTRLWPQNHLPITLPAGSRFLAAAVAGQWLDGVRPPEDGEPLHLPVPGGPDPVWVEILYTTPAPEVGAWSRLQAVAPELPLPLQEVEPRWLVPPGLRPLGDARWRLLPGVAGPPGLASVGARLVQLFHLGPVLPLPGRREDPRASLQQALTDAIADLRGDHGGQRLTLSAVVEDLAAGYLGERHPLVIDYTALRDSGDAHKPLTILPAGPARGPQAWEEEHLTLVPGRTAVLLTTHAEVQRWPGEQLPEGLAGAVEHTVGRGQDPSGRFLTALEWLHLVSGRSGGPGSAGGSPVERMTASRVMSGGDLDSWTVWAPLVGESGAGGERLTVVRGSTVSALGVLLTVLLAGGLVALRRRSERLRLWVVLGWLALAGLSAAWLPSALGELAGGPLLGGLLVGVALYLRWASRRLRGVAAPSTMARPANRSTPTTNTARPADGPAGRLGSSATLGVLLVSGLLAPGTLRLLAEGEPGDPEPVYLVPGDRASEATVLVRPALLARLRDLARAPLAPTSGAVLVSAAYEGRFVASGEGTGRADFLATFAAEVLGDATATLVLPLEGVQLTGDVLLDGARVLPTALASPQGGYSLRVRGAGRHKVEVRFQVPVPGPGAGPEAAEWQVRFTVPALAQNRLSFAGPAEAEALHAAVKHGGQRLLTEGGSRRLEADLGPVTTPLLIRWHQPGRPSRPPRVTFREAYLWELRLDASLLTGLLRYQVGDGAVSSLLLDLPTELEVRAATARRPAPAGPPGRGSEAPAVRLSNWTVTPGATRQLRLDFASPVAGAVEVQLELMPRGPWAATALLPLPRPHGQPATGTPGYLAYRAHGLSAVPANWLRLTGVEGKTFAPFWPTASRPEGESLTYASRFVRQASLGPELRLHMRPLEGRLAGSQRVDLKVTPTQAEVAVQVDLTSEGKDLSVLEWDIRSPRPVVLASVTGAGVSRWSQADNRLLVWLDRTTGATRLQISGWLPLALPPGRGKKSAEAARLDVPCFRLADAARVKTHLTLTPAAGVVVAAESLRELTPETAGAVRQHRYLARQADHGGTFTVRPGAPPLVEVVTTARLEGQEVVFSSVVDYRLQGELRTLHLRLRDWEGEATLEAPPRTVTRRREQHRRSAGTAPGLAEGALPPRSGPEASAGTDEWQGAPAQRIREQNWTLELAPGVIDHYQLQLRGRIALEDASGGIRLPSILLTGAQTRQRLVLDGSLAVESVSGVVATALPAGVPPGTQAWQPRDDAWSMRVRPGDPPQRAPARLLLTDTRTAVVGAGWLHEAHLWLRQEGPAELWLRWRRDVDLLVATADGVALIAGETVTRQLRLPPARGSTVRTVRVRYRLRPAESIAHPDLEAPFVAGARQGPVVWTVEVPPGWEAGPGSGALRLGSGATRRAVLELHHAEVQLEGLRVRLSQPLAPGSGEAAAALTADPIVARAQQQFLRSCRLAELALEAGAEPLRGLGPDNLAISTWLARLRQQYQALSTRHDLDPANDEAGVPANESLSEQVPPGSPHSWKIDTPAPGSPPRGAAMQLRLTPVAQRQARQAALFSAWWLLALGGVWLVSLSAVLRGVVRWLWPEEIALVGLVGWQVAGPTVLVLLLLLLAALARLVLLGQRVRRLLARWRTRDGDSVRSRSLA